MTDQSMFGNEPPKNPETPVTPQSDPFADKLQEIRNENGEPKYKDVQTALDALKNSQAFIEQLKREKRELEESHAATKSELEKMGTIDDYVNRLKPSTPQADPSKTVTPQGDGGLSEEKIAQLLEQQLSARERQNQAATNLNAVVSKLTETHGENASEFIKQRARELSTTPEKLKEMAMDNPTLALTLLGGTKQKPAAPSQSTAYPPRTPLDDNPMPRWEKSVVHGGLTNKELVEKWKEAKSYTHKRLGVE